jgi:hypothetical protein
MCTDLFSGRLVASVTKPRSARIAWKVMHMPLMQPVRAIRIRSFADL